MIELCAGNVNGTVDDALAKRIPSVARRSRCGVATRSEP